MRKCNETNPRGICGHRAPGGCDGEFIGRPCQFAGEEIATDGDIVVEVPDRFISSPIPLEQHVEEAFDGNVTAFGRSIGKHRQTVERWIAAGCWWFNDDVWGPKNVRGPDLPRRLD